MFPLIVSVAPARISGAQKEVIDGVERLHPCDLDSSNPCRNDGVEVLSTNNANIAFDKLITKGFFTTSRNNSRDHA